MDQTIPPSPPPSLFDRSSSTPNASSNYEDPTLLSHTSASAYRFQFPDLAGTASHFDSMMANTQAPHGLPLHYSNLHPVDDAGAYEITPGTASAPNPYTLTTPEASPPTAVQHLPGMAGGAAAPRTAQELRTLGVRSGRIEKNSKKKTAPSPPAPKKDKAAATAAEAAAMETETETAAEVSGPPGLSTLDRPLSILTKDWEIPVVDIATYVHRSVEDRRTEVEQGKVPGKIKRAMNAFMLYRKAYQDRAKRWAQQSNHQIVSKVCGQSWSMEPRTVRTQFNEWANIERDNHRMAHPEYKFTPSKPRKKIGDTFDDFSDPEDPDWDVGRRRSNSRTPLRDLDGDYRPSHTPYTNPYATSVSHLPSYYPLQRPSHLSGPAGHSVSMAYDTDPYGTGELHYQPVAVAGGHPHQPQHPLGSGLSFTTAPQSMDLGTAHHSMDAHHRLGQHVDPALAHYDMSGPLIGDNWQPGMPLGMPPNSAEQDMYAGPYFAEMDESYMQDNQLQYLRGGDETWKIDTINESEVWHPE
ncbi:hmg box protein [Grosmannia clavigera kw1407]|uniref:Hmg box protein n=1 Tax=Grosmannia clavigera (strain kw1407 / UAMH 11150) TaxID=655863 RepID=F0XMH0_GROCL|nr:hmg box protein [Grosmannia clavigera kw1407]EFX01060.1 hmg box protein [Grosmannia clavigera kw1407]